LKPSELITLTTFGVLQEGRIMKPAGSPVLLRSWSWILLPSAAVSLAALVLVIGSLIHTIRRAVLLRAPLVPSQEVEFRQPGAVILCLEGPRFSRRQAHLKFSLTGTDGQPVAGRGTLFHASTTFVTTARIELRKFDLPHSGRYQLAIDGMGAPQPDDAKHQVVFVRPHMHLLPLFILGLIVAMGAFIVSLVFFFVPSKGTGTAP
jgi:hypothetical protein